MSASSLEPVCALLLKGVNAAAWRAGDGNAVSSGAWGLQAGRRFAAAFPRVPRGVDAAAWGAGLG